MYSSGRKSDLRLLHHTSRAIAVGQLLYPAHGVLAFQTVLLCHARYHISFGMKSSDDTRFLGWPPVRLNRESCVPGSVADPGPQGGDGRRTTARMAVWLIGHRRRPGACHVREHRAAVVVNDTASSSRHRDGGQPAAHPARCSGLSPHRLNQQRRPDDDEADVDVEEELMPLHAPVDRPAQEDCRHGRGAVIAPAILPRLQRL